MKDLTIVFPVLDEKLSLLERTLAPLLTGIEGKNAQIIIIDNSKVEHHTFNNPQIRHIRNRRNVGVGASFNQGVELADSERLVLMGCDVIVQDEWYDRIIKTLDDHPNTIFTSTSSGFSDAKDEEGNYYQLPFRRDRPIRYAAHIVYKMGHDDLPEGSGLRGDKKFSRILQGRWNPVQPGIGQEFGTVGCLMGAFYWMNKADFQKLRGWNHHKMWGTLEPTLSLKARAQGMKILVDKRIEGAHYFGRHPNRPSKPHFQYFNMLFLAHTCFTPALAGELEYFLRYGDREAKVEKLQVNNARVMLKRINGAVAAERDYNQRHFVGGLIANIDNFERFMI